MEKTVLESEGKAKKRSTISSFSPDEKKVGLPIQGARDGKRLRRNRETISFLKRVYSHYVIRNSMLFL